MERRDRSVNWIGLVILLGCVGGYVLYLTQCRGMSLQEVYQEASDHSPGGPKSPGRKLMDDAVGD